MHQRSATGGSTWIGATKVHLKEGDRIAKRKYNPKNARLIQKGVIKMRQRGLVIVCSIGIGAFGILGATGTTYPNLNNSSANAQVTITGTPLPAPSIPSNAIYLNPGQAVPSDAQVGQVYVLPNVLPPDSQNMLVVRANPGQAVNISGYSGPVVIDPTIPTIATILPSTTKSSSSTATSSSVGTGPKDATYVATVTPTSGPETTNPILDFNGTWVTDNHVLNYYNPNNGDMYPPEKLTISNASGNIIEQITGGIEDVYNQSLGLASPYNVAAPTGSDHEITVVNDQTLNQSATVLNAWNPSAATNGYTTQDVTLNGKEQSPPGNPWPDPTAPIYNTFDPIGSVGPGWSGAGIWNGSNHLLAMVEGGDTNNNEIYGFNGADIINFCSEYSVPYSESSGT
jgi:hypothetical protein